jgi:insulysin
LDTVIIDNVFERKDLRVLLEKFTFEDFKQMQDKWLRTGISVWFVHGNFEKQNAVEFVDEARQILDLKGVSKDTLSTVRCVQIVGCHNRVDFENED